MTERATPAILSRSRIRSEARFRLARASLRLCCDSGEPLGERA
jgi:hypothetical protein